jgi:hypothetical protein
MQFILSGHGNFIRLVRSSVDHICTVSRSCGRPQKSGLFQVGRKAASFRSGFDAHTFKVEENH